MPINQGIAIYFGPDSQYHFDQKIDVITWTAYKEITSALHSLNLVDSPPQLIISFNVLIECVNKINKLCHETNEWPEDDWIRINDKETGQEYDVNFFLDEYADGNHSTGKVDVYLVDKEGNTQTDVWRTVYITTLR